MARIRTIKPEFWSHPQLGKCEDSTKLMAIALLNFSDDEGYFHAEPNLVRGFARPFDEDSTITRRALSQLIKIGFISVFDNNEYGIVGRVEKFDLHQRIDRPTPSKLSCYYDSSSPRRALDEPSLLEQGTGNREQGMDKVVLPPAKPKDVVWEFYKKEIEISNNDPDYKKFVDFLYGNSERNKEKCVVVLAIKDQLKYYQFNRVVAIWNVKLNSKPLFEIVLDLENYKNASKKYTSLNITLQKWIKLDQQRNNK